MTRSHISISLNFPTTKQMVNKHKKSNVITRSTGQEIPPDNAFQNWRFPRTLKPQNRKTQKSKKHLDECERIKIKTLNTKQHKNQNFEIRTWPPTTATEGRASQRDMPSPPWSPRTVQARWILLMRPIRLCNVAI